MAPRVDALFATLLALAFGFATAIAGLIVYFGVKYRRRPGNLVAQPVRDNWTLELAWTAVPLGLALAIFGWGAWLYLDLSTPPKDALEVYVVAKQWMWEFQQLDGQREIGELHVPIGRPVRLTMISQDVIHSFYVPDFRVKADVLPGRYSTVWFEATQAGRFRIFCAEYCGSAHAQMLGTVVALSPADYATWLSGGAAGSLAAQGAQLFQQLACNSCHRDDALRRAPVLAGLYGQAVQLDDGAVVVADEDYLRRSILDPGAQVVAGYQPIMPTFAGQVSEAQLAQLVAYIKSLAAPQPGPPPVNTPATPGALPTP